VPTTRRDDGGRPAGAPLARIALALLVAATCAALLIAQQLKHEQPLVDASAAWHPAGGTFNPRGGAASVDFVTNYRDRVSITVVSTRTGRVVATLARDYAVSPNLRTEAFPWNGRSTTGVIEPTGTYVVDVHFDRLDRTLQIPQVSFKLGPGK
jgi:hypothetical protein